MLRKRTDGKAAGGRSRKGVRSLFLTPHRKLTRSVSSPSTALRQATWCSTYSIAVSVDAPLLAPACGLRRMGRQPGIASILLLSRRRIGSREKTPDSFHPRLKRHHTGRTWEDPEGFPRRHRHQIKTIGSSTPSSGTTHVCRRMRVGYQNPYLASNTRIGYLQSWFERVGGTDETSGQWRAVCFDL